MGLGPPARAVPGEASTFSESQNARSAQQLVARVAELRKVHQAFAWFRSQARELEDLQMAVSGIPAPPWEEAERSEWLRARFAELNLANVHTDELGNVFAVRTGTDPKAPYIALSAHLDTVFPAGTNVEPRREAGKLYGPGISDNASGITALLAIAGAVCATEIATAAPVLFIGNVGEEGEGDLRGMRHIFQQPQWSQSIASLIALDGAGTDTIICEGLGSRRYELTVRGPGGHSWSDFGVPNPIVAHGAGDRTLHAHAGSGDAEDDLQHRHDSGRHLGQLDSRVRDDPRGHALGIGKGAGPTGARLARSGGRDRAANDRPQSHRRP